MPINRIVAFLGPYIAVASGVITDWLVVHVHALTTFHITRGTVSYAISQIAVFGITSILVYAGQHKWLTGWQQYQSLIADEAINGPDAEQHPDGSTYEAAAVAEMPESAAPPDLEP